MRAIWLTLALAFTGAVVPLAAEAVITRYQLNIPRQALDAALKDFAQQTGLQIARFSDIGDSGAIVGPITGDYSAEDALTTLLAPSGLTHHRVNERTIAITTPGAVLLTSAAPTAGGGIPATNGAGTASNWNWSDAIRLAQADTSSADDKEKAAQSLLSESQELPAPEETGKAIPEFLVKGAKTLNADIRRTEDDVQPYVVLGAEEISRSQALNLEDFLKTRLPMNTADRTIDQRDAANLNSGGINLRGLGTNQTLILVDGRRLPSVASTEGFGQPDISGIPLSSIERIEVLPTTASGIYGGGATGGAINIIRKRDYTGLNVEAKYGNVFEADASSIELSANGGASLEGGRTQVVITATYAKADPLLVSERDFASYARERLWANNPASIRTAPFAPVGATPNICASRFSFLPLCGSTALTLDSGQSLGSSITSVPVGYSGPASDGGAALATGAGRYNLEIPDDEGGVLLRTPLRKSLALSARREFGTSIEGFIDVSANRSESEFSSPGALIPVLLPADAPNNPFQQPIAVQVSVPAVKFPSRSETEMLQATGGIVAHLPKDWAATLEHTWSRDRNTFMSTSGPRLTAEGLSLLSASALQDLNQNPVDFTPYLLPVFNNVGGPYDTILQTTSLRISGPTLTVPAGPISVTGLIERREEEARAAFEEHPLGNTLVTRIQLVPERTQVVNSYYLEARLPIIGPEQSRSFLDSLELQVAIRHDEYETVSTSSIPTAATREGPFAPADYFTNEVSSTDHTFGIRFAPLRALTFRASYGTGFLPPSLSQIMPLSELQEFPLDIPDPRRGNTEPFIGVPITLIVGGNPNLQPEQSESWSGGLIFAPESLEGLRCSVDYTRIRKTGEISATDAAFILQNEALYPDRVVRGPRLVDDPPEWAGPVTQIDQSAINLAATDVEAYDFQLDYAWKTERFGAFHFSTVLTRMTELIRQATPATAAYDSVGFSDGPLLWRGQAALTWEQASYTANWSAQYYDDYSIRLANPSSAASNDARVTAQGSARIPSQLYHDLWARYDFSTARVSALQNMSLSLGIQNVFNTSPPTVVPSSAAGLRNVAPYGYSTYGDPRLRRYMLSVQKSFGN